MLANQHHDMMQALKGKMITQYWLVIAKHSQRSDLSASGSFPSANSSSTPGGSSLAHNSSSCVNMYVEPQMALTLPLFTSLT